MFILSVCRLDRVSYKQKDEILVSGIDDIVTILKSDYENAYFLTGGYYLKCLIIIVILLIF